MRNVRLGRPKRRRKGWIQLEIRIKTAHEINNMPFLAVQVIQATKDTHKAISRGGIMVAIKTYPSHPLIIHKVQ